MGELGAEPHAAPALGADLRIQGAGQLCVGSNGGTPARGEDQSQGHLPRPGTFEPFAFCEGESAALAELDAVGAHPLGRAGVGLALPDPLRVAPSERYYSGKVRGHKKVLDWGRQMLMQLRRWLPDRKLIIVAESEFARFCRCFG